MPLSPAALTGIGGNVTAGTLAHTNATAITNNLSSTPAFVNAVEPNNNTTGTPQAYLTIIFFDERFNFIAAADGGVAQQQVASSWTTSTPALALSNIKAPKNGYAYIYVSNRSDQDVYFDNLVAGVVTSNIIEEDHYYAFGLKIAAISSKKLGDANEGILQNNYLYQGAFNEMDADIGWNDFPLRNYDPQIGRWVQQDPEQEFNSPYVGMGDDPVNNIDPSGGDIFAGISFGGKMLMGAIVGGVVGTIIDEASGGDGAKGWAIGAIGGALAPGISQVTLKVAVVMGLHAAVIAGDILNNTLKAVPAGSVELEVNTSYKIIQVVNSAPDANLSDQGGNGGWEELTKEALLYLVNKDNPFPVKPPFVPSSKEMGLLEYKAGYVLQNTFNEYMKKSLTYVPNTFRIRILGVEPDGFDSGVEIDIGDGKIQPDMFNTWYEIKATKKNNITPSYAQVGKEVKAMASVYKDKIKKGDVVVFVLVTTSNVMIGDENKLMKDANDAGITFIHVVAKYRVTANGDIEVKFEIKTGSGAGRFKTIIDGPMNYYDPVKLQLPPWLKFAY